MALRIPSREELSHLAQTMGFTLSAAETDAYAALMPGVFGLLNQLEQLPEPHPPRAFPEREPGHRPKPEDDPLNAIVRRCSIAGSSSGLLAGKRVGLKDNISVAGIPMTCGSTVLQGLTSDTDATIVTRLLEAGAEIVAILNMDNFAFSGEGNTSAYGPTLNPHSLNHLAGGSSGGSAAALYYDDIDVTIGGDQAGSIRIPASWCGVVGLKPTHSLVPYTGIVGIDQTFDHVGPMGRCVADVAQVLDVMAGKDPLDPRQYDVPVQAYAAALGPDLDGVRIGVLREGFGAPGSEPDVDAAVRATLDQLAAHGASVTEVSVPAHITARALHRGLVTEGMAALLQHNGMGYHWRGAYNANLAIAFGKGLQTMADDLPPNVKLLTMVGTYLRQHYHSRIYAKAQNLRPSFRAQYDEVLSQVDVLAMPTTPMKAHLHEAAAISKRVYLAVDHDRDRAEKRLREWFGVRYGNAEMASKVSIWGSRDECLKRVLDDSYTHGEPLYNRGKSEGLTTRSPDQRGLPMGYTAEVISLEEVRASHQRQALRQHLHERFDQWLDEVETQ